MSRFYIVLIVCFGAGAYAQVGGSDNYRFLMLPNSARLTALGSVNVSAPTDDIGIAVFNPAILNESHHQSLMFSHQFYHAGIQNGYFAYSHHIGGRHDITLHTGFQYISYGDFLWTDEFDQQLGNFSAGEFAWTVGGSFQLYERLRLGMNSKLINSSLDDFNSYAMGLDFGAHYMIDETFWLGLTVLNAGFVLQSYTETGGERLPYDVRLGLSKKLNKAPIRFSVSAHNLHRWNLMYDNPESEERNTLFQDEVPEPNRFSQMTENFFRHLVFGVEILVGKQENFKVFAAYNHFRNRELSVLNFRSFTGFSGGFAFRVKQFEIGYGFGTYHLAGSAHQLTISTNLTRFGKDIIID